MDWPLSASVTREIMTVGDADDLDLDLVIPEEYMATNEKSWTQKRAQNQSEEMHDTSRWNGRTRAQTSYLLSYLNACLKL